MKNYYKILGLKPDATPEQIDAIYEKLLDWQEKFPDAYNDERREDIDTAYDTLRDPELRMTYDQQLKQHEAQLLARHTRRDYPQPTVRRPLPPPSSGKNTLGGRTAAGIIIFVIFFVLRVLARGGAFDSNDPTPFRFITPDYSFSFNTPRPFTFSTPRPFTTSLGATCTGYTSSATVGYAEDRSTVERSIPAGTMLVFRRSAVDWYEIVGAVYGHYIRASAITTYTCFDSGSGPALRPTSTPIPAADRINICHVIGSSDEPITVYSRPSLTSEAEGELAAHSRFLAIRENDSWYEISGVTGRQFSGGYVHSFEIDVLTCTGDTPTPRPTRLPTETPAIPFGG